MYDGLIKPYMVAVAGFVILFATFAAQASDPLWQEVRYKDGIRVLATDSTETRILKVKAVAVIDAGFDRVKAILDDIEHHGDWVPYLIQTRELQSLSATEKLLYSCFDAPWPARNRDFVYHMKISQLENGKIIYQQQSQQSSLMPEQDDYVRAVLMEGAYSLTPVDAGHTEVELLFYTDPRGSLPLWIVNIVQRAFPFEALKRLREMALMAE